MLHVSGATAIRNVFVDTYCRMVAARKNIGGWSLPKAWNNTVDKVLESMASRGVTDGDDVACFVEAQFLLDTSFCKRVFNLPYPPIHLFLTDKAHHRYLEHKLRTMKPGTVDKHQRVWNTICLDMSRIGSAKETVPWDFYVMSGYMSFHTIAYVYLTGGMDASRYCDILRMMLSTDVYDAQAVVENESDVERVIISIGGRGAVKNYPRAAAIAQETW